MRYKKRRNSYHNYNRANSYNNYIKPNHNKEIIEQTEIKINFTETTKEQIINIESTVIIDIITELKDIDADETEIITEEKEIITEAKEISSETKEIIIEVKEFDTEEIITEKIKNIVYPEEYYKNPSNCQAIYENKCLSSCPKDTCLTQADQALVTCIPTEENVKVFNDICFENLNFYTNNIKQLAENKTSITTESGIIISGYSTKSVDEEIEKGVTHSLVYLGECEDKLREYYKIPDFMDIFIFGIDTPNKNKSYATTVYNYEVYLDNGTQLDFPNVCDGTKISLSSAIIDTDLIKYDEASYFSELGYDIYNNS